MPFESPPDLSKRDADSDFVSPEEFGAVRPEVTPLFESKHIDENDQVLAITDVNQIKGLISEFTQGRTHFIREVEYGTSTTYAGAGVPAEYELYYNRFPQSPNQEDAWYSVKELGTTRDGSKAVINYGSIEKIPVSNRSVRLVLVKKADQREAPTQTPDETREETETLVERGGHTPARERPRAREDDAILHSEKKETDSISEWGVEVKRLFASDQAQAFVNARTNFDITEKDGKQVVSHRLGHREGYGYTMLRGGLTREQAEAAYSIVTENVQRNNKMFPQRRETQTLYVTSVTHDQIERLPGGRSEQLRQRLGGITEGKTVIAFDYMQEKVDTSNRSGGKSVYLVVPNEVADKFDALIEAGADPSDIHQSLVSIFTTPETQDYFDASLLDTRGDTPKVTKRPVEPKFREVKLVT